MWAIFCSLPFCAFQMVIADSLQDNIYASQNALIPQFNDVQSDAFSYVLTASKAVKIKEMKGQQVFDRCTSTDFDQQFAQSYGDTWPKLDKCYLNVKNTKDIQNAENCSKKLLAQLKKDAKSFRSQAKKCIAKCARDESKCREELKKIEDKQLQDFQNGDNGGTQIE